MDYSDDDNPLGVKSDFVLSLCELIMGSRDGIEAEEKSVIDRCLPLVYQKYFADVDESAEASKVEATQTEQSTDKEEKKDEAASTSEVLPEDGTDKGTAFTTPGNGEVKDDITDDSTKEFLTVTTKNNNTFYIVIDRSATSQNVYMLSQIDENDLSEFLDKDSTATVVTPQPKSCAAENTNQQIQRVKAGKRIVQGYRKGMKKAEDFRR